MGQVIAQDIGQVRVARDVPQNVMDVVSAGKPMALLFPEQRLHAPVSSGGQ
jgi:hypothetical protein